MTPNTGMQRMPLSATADAESLGGLVKRLPKLQWLVVALLALGLSLCAEGASRPLEFHLAEQEAASGLTARHIEGRAEVVYLHSKIELDDRDIDTAKPVPDRGDRPAVQVHLTKTGVARMRSLTAKHQRQLLAIVAGGKVIMAPMILGQLVEDFLDITGNFSPDEAAQLARILNHK